MFLIMGFFLFWIVISVFMDWWKCSNVYLLLLGLGLLVLVFIVGCEVNGVKCWIFIGFVGF